MVLTLAGIVTLFKFWQSKNAYHSILIMVWLLSIFMERCKCLFMGISGVSSFHPIAPKTVKSWKKGVKIGVCLWDVCQI